MIGLKFLFDRGTFLNIVLEESKAREIITAFLSGNLDKILGQTDNPLGLWAIKSDTIVAIHSVPLDQQPVVQQAPQVPSPFPWMGASGRN